MIFGCSNALYRSIVGSFPAFLHQFAMSFNKPTMDFDLKHNHK